jgi:O-antigen/teichoic acid export membrane protein
MVFATVASGVFMWAVHLFSKVIPPAEYGVLGTMLQLLNWVVIPAVGLQMVFAQQSSAAAGEDGRRAVAATVRAVMKGVFALWLAVALFVGWRQAELCEMFKVANPAALWATLAAGLALLWLPILQGVLQGRQNFLWFGISGMCGGAGRFIGAGVIVLAFGGWAAGIMTGVLLGLLAALAVAAWQCRDVFHGAVPPFAGREWLRRVVPLTVGFGAGQFLFSADQVFVQANFAAESTGPYVAAGTLSRALVMFTGPLAAVMFPKIVRSVVRAEGTDVLRFTLLGTLAMGGGGALALSVMAPLFITIGFNPKFVSIAPLVPWFVWAMLPLALATVLVNNLMAREVFRAVPALAAVAGVYACALGMLVPKFAAALPSAEGFVRVTQVLGCFNLLLLAVAAWFTWRGK